ncbi:hypothetical protein CB1_000849014 [Camelus ferus]|nr:hypothetical protein CB1_000849014 [Camelus ferus]
MLRDFTDTDCGLQVPVPLRGEELAPHSRGGSPPLTTESWGSWRDVEPPSRRRPGTGRSVEPPAAPGSGSLAAHVPSAALPPSPVTVFKASSEKQFLHVGMTQAGLCSSRSPGCASSLCWFRVTALGCRLWTGFCMQFAGDCAEEQVLPLGRASITAVHVQGTCVLAWQQGDTTRSLCDDGRGVGASVSFPPARGRQGERCFFATKSACE